MYPGKGYELAGVENRIGDIRYCEKTEKNVLLRAPRLAVSKPGVGLGSVFSLFLCFICVLLECKESMTRLLPQCGLTCTSSFIIENATIG